MRSLALRLSYEAVIALPAGSRLWRAALPYAGRYAELTTDPVLADDCRPTRGEMAAITAVWIVIVLMIIAAINGSI